MSDEQTNPVDPPAESAPAQPHPPADQQPPAPAASAPPPAAESPAPAEPAADTPAPEAPAAETPAPETPAAETSAPETPAAETPASAGPAPTTPAGPETPAPARREPAAADAGAETPRVKPAVPGADLEVDIVPEGTDPLARQNADPYADDDEPEPAVEEVDEQVVAVQPIEQVAIDLAAGARYRATGKRKTAIARVTLRPGNGAYTVNGKTLEEYFPRATLQRNIRQPLETVGFEARMDVVARLQGGGISAQGGALRHGISRALLEADPNLRGELTRRGFLTRDARAKERKKAGLKKARKRPQFSKR
ncbi:MAG: small subunit ribosomal protein [Solirubrobacteraceae bacterium]|nr:small subunit ribosomal protein [Solirubrobacteraceae bacterium]